MDSNSTLIIPQSHDECVHHEVECTHFNIIQVNNISHDQQTNIDHNTPINIQYTFLNGNEDDQKSKPSKTTSVKLENSSSENNIISSQQNENNLNDEKNKDKKPKTAINELKIMIKLAIPVSITSIARVVMWNTDQIFLGHLGTSQLAGL